jgi:hypothetical protein
VKVGATQPSTNMKNRKVLPLALLLLLSGCGGEKSTKLSAAEPSPRADGSDGTAMTGRPVSDAMAPTASIRARMVEWKLTPDDIRSEWQRPEGVVRLKTPEVGAPAGKVGSDQLTNQINAKYKDDAELSKVALSIDVAQDAVTLRGTVPSLEIMGRVIALALDTEGINKTVSLLKLVSP